MIALAKNINDPLLNSDAFAFVNIFLFFLSNGIATSKYLVIQMETLLLHLKLLKLIRHMQECYVVCAFKWEYFWALF